MKAAYKIIALCALTATFFCACNSTVPTDTGVPNQTSSGGENNVVMSENSSSILGMDTQPFELALPCEVTIYGSGNETGFYEVFSNDDLSKNIMYTDYATQRQIYLCSQPNCMHNSETCTSWIEPNAGMVYPVALNDGVALIYSNLNDFSKIETADFNGSNRKILTDFGAGVEIDPGAAVNDQYIVIKITEHLTDDSGQVSTTHVLVAVDLHSGEKYELYSTKEQENLSPTDPGYISMFFRGVTDSGFIVKTIQVMDAPVAESSESGEIFIGQEHTIFEIPFDGSEIKTLLKFHQNECFEEPFGEYLFYLKNNGEGQYSLEKINTQTLEHSVIIQDFSQTNLQTPISEVPFSDTILRARVNDYVVLNTLASSGYNDRKDIELIYKSYAVNINTGEMKEITLDTYYSATRLPVSIIAQTSTDLLVHAKVEEVKIPGTEIPITERLMGLISKEDYLASREEYRMIDALRKPM